MGFKPTRVFLHCAATPDYPEGDAKYDLFGAADIDAWHKQRGFDEIGYHFVIRRTGEIEKGRSILKKGAHVKGCNFNSIGICYIGTRWPTKEQVKSIIKLYRKIYNSYKINYDNWYGHYEENKSKTCPGFSMHLFRELMRGKKRGPIVS